MQRLTENTCRSVPQGKLPFPSGAGQTPTPVANKLRSSRWFLENTKSKGAMPAYPLGPALARLQEEGGELAGAGRQGWSRGQGARRGCIPDPGEKGGQWLRVLGQHRPEVQGMRECVKWPVGSHWIPQPPLSS